MKHRQHVDLRLRRNRVNDPIRQPDDRKLARPLDLADMPQHRELSEHHRRLHDPADHALCRTIIILRDPIADRDQIVPRLRREANPQA